MHIEMPAGGQIGLETRTHSFMLIPVFPFSAKQVSRALSKSEKEKRGVNDRRSRNTNYSREWEHGWVEGCRIRLILPEA